MQMCDPDSDGTPQHRHPPFNYCHPVTRKHRGAGSHPVPGETGYTDPTIVNEKARRITEIPLTEEDLSFEAPNTGKKKDYLSRLQRGIFKDKGIDPMTASRLDKAMGSLMKETMPNIKNFVPTVEELLGDDDPDSYLDWEMRYRDKIPHTKKMISSMRKYLKEQKQYIEVMDKEVYNPIMTLSNDRIMFYTPDILPHSMLRNTEDFVRFSNEGLHDEMMSLVNLTYLYGMNQMLTNTGREHAMIGMADLITDTVYAFEDSMHGRWEGDRRYHYIIVSRIRDKLENMASPLYDKIREQQPFEDGEIQNVLQEMLSTMEGGFVDDDGEQLHPILTGFVEQTQTFIDMLNDDEDSEVIGQGPIDVSLSGKIPDCPNGQHYHEPFDYCHPIERRHRELNGSTGDPMMDARIVDDYEFQKEKEGILSDDKVQEEQRLHREMYTESLKRLESLHSEMRTPLQHIADSIPQTNEDNRRLTQLFKRKIDDIDQVLKGSQAIIDGDTTERTMYHTLNSVQSLNNMKSTFKSLFASDLPDDIKGDLFSTAFGIEDRMVEVAEASEQLALSSILSRQPMVAWRTDAKKDATTMSDALQKVSDGISDDSNYAKAVSTIKNVCTSLRVIDRLNQGEDTYADYKIIMDKILIESEIYVDSDANILVPSSVLAYLFTHSGNKESYKQNTTLGETKGLNKKYGYQHIQSHKDAKEVINKHGITISPKSLPLEIVPPNILDNVINALVEMKDISGGFAPPIAFTQDSSEGLGGFFSRTTLEVSIPINTDSWDTDDIQSFQYENRYSSGHSTSYHPHHIIRHELGHALHVYNRIGEEKYKAVMDDMKSIRPSKENDEFMRVRAKHGVYLPRTEEAIRDSDSTTYDSLFIRKKDRNLLRPSLLKDIYRYVSDYGATNINELVAEMYSGMLDGKKYPDSLKRTYKIVGGYWPEGEDMP